MAKAVADPEELRRFAQMLKAFNANMAQAMQQLQGNAIALGQTWRRIYGEFMPQSAYRQLDLPTIENYLLWDEAGDRCRVEIMIPVSK